MQFIESVHKYIENGTEYTPVTYFLKSFEEWVDWDNECKKKAKKLGITYEELKKQWDDKRDKSAEKGTAYHKMKEIEYLNGKGIVIENTLCPVSSVPTIEGVKNDDSMKLDDNTVYCEKMVWSNKYRICGTADLVEVFDGKVYVKDYKTNEKLDKESYKHPIYGYKKLKFPVNSLDDCNFNKYQLQLNTYMYLLLQQNRNLKFGGMEILHVIFDDDLNYKETIIHPVKPMAAEIKAMMENFAKKKGYI